MKKFINELFTGKDNRLSGLIALTIVAMIVLGCNCNKSFDLANLGKNDSNSTNVSNTSGTSNTYSNSTNSSRPVAPADASTGQVPSDEQLEALARETVLDFNSAIQKGDFVDFHRTISKPFQKSATPEKFAEAFKQFLTVKPDFSEVASLPATFTSTPVIEREVGYNTLKFNGTFNTSPRPTKFELKYIPEGKEWKLILIRISTRDE